MPIPPKIYRGTDSLRRGRRSIPGCDYFLTCCVQRQRSGLTRPGIALQVTAQLHEIEARGIWHVRTAVLMPDHLHLLITISSGIDLSQAMRLFKGPLAPLLRTNGLQWQESFYDHHLRADVELLPTFLYIFLNPYRSNLIEAGHKWPWYQCSPDDWEWFSGITDEARPFPEWLK